MCGFYDSDINGEAIPADAVEITPELRSTLLAAQSEGKIIDFSVVPPVAIDPPSPPLSVIKAALAERLDGHAAAIYSRWTRFEAEYRARKAAAQTFKDAGYQGEPGLYVTSFAEPAGLTAHAAADAILAQAAALRTAQDALAALRMRKYDVARATAAEAAKALSDEIVAAMDEIARGIA